MKKETHAVRSLALLAVSFTVFACLCVVVTLGKTLQFDNYLLSVIQLQRTRPLTVTMITISALGHEIMLCVLIFFAAMLIFHDKLRSALTITCALAGSFILNTGLKIIFARPRPAFSPLVELNDASFPSGHAMNATVFYTLLLLIVIREVKNIRLRVLLSLTIALLLLAIGFSRMYLGVHYFTDVLAGYAAGACVVAVTLIIDCLAISKRV